MNCPSSNGVEDVSSRLSLEYAVRVGSTDPDVNG